MGVIFESRPRFPIGADPDVTRCIAPRYREPPGAEQIEDAHVFPLDDVDRHHALQELVPADLGHVGLDLHLACALRLERAGLLLLGAQRTALPVPSLGLPRVDIRLPALRSRDPGLHHLVDGRGRDLQVFCKRSFGPFAVPRLRNNTPSPDLIVARAVRHSRGTRMAAPIREPNTGT